MFGVKSAVAEYPLKNVTELKFLPLISHVVRVLEVQWGGT
jgi:hypothetical protein